MPARARAPGGIHPAGREELWPGGRADEGVALLSPPPQNEHAFDEVIQNANFTSHEFRIRVKLEMFNVRGLGGGVSPYRGCWAAGDQLVLQLCLAWKAHTHTHPHSLKRQERLGHSGGHSPDGSRSCQEGVSCSRPGLLRGAGLGQQKLPCRGVPRGLSRVSCGLLGWAGIA